MEISDRDVSLRSLSLVALVLATLYRLTYLWAPLTVDEGGAFAVVRAWASSGTAYEHAWVDRPQGWLLIYRIWDTLPLWLGSVRLVAIIAGIVCALALGSIARTLHSPRAGHYAVIFGSLLMAAPTIEGYLANGELLSMMFSLPALALALQVVLGRRHWSWLLAAGLLSGAGLSVKQSAFDGLLALGIWSVVSVAAGWGRPARAVRDVSLLAAGTVAVLGACVWHGVVSIGWSDYWYAQVGYHTAERSGASNPRIVDGLLNNTLFTLPSFLIALAILFHYRSRRSISAPARDRRGSFLYVWTAVALLAFGTGGNFHRHYFIILAAPIAVAAAIALAAVGGGTAANLRYFFVGSIVTALPFIVSPAVAVGERNYDHQRVADWVSTREGSVGHDLSVYAFCSAAPLYPLLGQHPGYRYLWRDNLEMIPGAQDELYRYLSGPDAPAVIARYQDCDVDASITDLIERKYVVVDEVSGVEMLVERT